MKILSFGAGMQSTALALMSCENVFAKSDGKELPYGKLLAVDTLLEENTPKPPTESKLYISRSRKRLLELSAEDCNDAEYFLYRGNPVWNGF